MLNYFNMGQQPNLTLRFAKQSGRTEQREEKISIERLSKKKLYNSNSFDSGTAEMNDTKLPTFS